MFSLLTHIWRRSLTPPKDTFPEGENLQREQSLYLGFCAHAMNAVQQPMQLVLS